MTTVAPEFGVFEMPYLVQSREHAARIRDQIIHPTLAPIAAKKGYRIIGVWENGIRHITNNRRPIVTPADLQGIKLRVPQGVWRVKMFQAYGANPSPMALSEVFVALQTGVMDGQENPLTLVESFRFYEVQKHCTLTRHTWDGWLPVANARAWERLPGDLRNIVTTNFRKAALLQRKDVEAQNAAVQTALAAKGMQFHSASPAF